MATVTDLFQKYDGIKEYNGIVATIQTWFYGYVYRGSWCATSMSYMLDQLGLLGKIGKKQENVYNMMKMCENAAKSGVGEFHYRDDIPYGYTIPRGTIVFMLNSGTTMTTSSSKHVTSAYEAFTFKKSGSWYGEGGNQSDMIRKSQYAQAKIYAIYFPPYQEDPKPDDPKTTHPTVKRGSKGDAVKELQEDLNTLGYTDSNNAKLDIDGSFGARTEQAVKKLQKANGLVVDGSCGPKTWAKIDELLDKIEPGTKVKTLDQLNVRSGPGTQYSILKVLKKDTICTWTHENGNWIYLKEPAGWVNANYVTTKI